MTQLSKHRPATPRQAARCCRAIDQWLNPVMFKALADPQRAALVSCLAKCSRACSVGEVAECCSIDFSVVSRHLALLARAGILECTKHGRTVFYRVRYNQLSRWLRSLADSIDECRPKQSAADPAGDVCCDPGCCSN